MLQANSPLGNSYPSMQQDSNMPKSCHSLKSSSSSQVSDILEHLLDIQPHHPGTSCTLKVHLALSASRCLLHRLDIFRLRASIHLPDNFSHPTASLKSGFPRDPLNWFLLVSNMALNRYYYRLRFPCCLGYPYSHHQF